LDAAVFVLPLDQAKKRVTKKPFGMFIDKKTSLIQPERFTGYHTGTDFETFPDEAAIDVPVHAICDGMLAMKRTASGYGGVAVESCTLSGEPITVVYGHLRLTSVDASVGTKVSAGDIIGVLGTGYGTETDGERKHLHLGIHKGGMIDITGYVSSSALLSGWTDPVPLISK
jgi:murein DD-endopeptidase MepM/ murein hydrolase activator NlpD